MYRKFFKRVFDMVSSGTAILVLLSFFIIFTPIVAIAMKGNPFFVQKRPGKDCKTFSMIKYRTMTNAKDKEGNLLPDVDRLTRFGSLMRKLSIDEIPELFNILKGDMSVVGPRPLLPQYLILFNEEQIKRQLVRPGLTGYAQVNGRNSITWTERLKMDVDYVQNITFLNDLKIILKTIKKVFKKEGITFTNQKSIYDELRKDNNHNEGDKL